MGALHGGLGPRGKGPRREQLLQLAAIEEDSTGEGSRGLCEATLNLTTVNTVSSTILERMTNDRKSGT